MDVIKNVALMFILFIFTYEDIRYKAVGLIELCVIGILEIGYIAYVQKPDFKELLLIILFSVLMISVSLMTKIIGMGDVFIITEIMLLKGMFFGISVIYISFTLLGLFWIALKIFKRVKKKLQIPFVPFLTISSLGVILCV